MGIHNALFSLSLLMHIFTHLYLVGMATLSLTLIVITWHEWMNDTPELIDMLIPLPHERTNIHEPNEPDLTGMPNQNTNSLMKFPRMPPTWKRTFVLPNENKLSWNIQRTNERFVVEQMCWMNSLITLSWISWLSNELDLDGRYIQTRSLNEWLVEWKTPSTNLTHGNNLFWVHESIHPW